MNKEYTLTMLDRLVLTDPDTGEDLKLFQDPKVVDSNNFVVIVSNQDGSRLWKHTIKTEQILDYPV